MGNHFNVMIATLQDLINALEGLVAGSPGAQYLLLSPAAFEAAAELVSYLGPQTQTLRIDQRPGEDLIQIASGSVAVVGSAVLFGKIPYDVRIEGTVPAPDEVVLDLSATVPDGAAWTFAANFPSLPGYYGFNPADRRIGFQPTSFFAAEAGFGLVPVGGGAPVFTATTDPASAQPPGLRIHGLLDASVGVLGSHLTAILPAGMISDLKLSGRVSWLAGLASPLLELTADLPSPLDPRASAATLILGTSTPVSAYPNGLSTADLSSQVDLDVGTGTSRWPPFQLTGPVLNGPYGWTLSAEIPDGSGYTLAGALAALARFAGGQLTVPDGLQSLDTFRLGSITLGFSPGDDGTPSLALAGVEVTSAEQWTLPLTGLTLQNLRLSWEFVDPGSAEMSLFGGLTGVLFIGTPTGAPGDKTPRLRVEIDLNEASGESTAFTLSAALDPRYPLNFIDLFNHFTGWSIDLDFPVASFALEAESATRSLSFVAVLGESSGTQLHSAFSLDTLIVAFDYTPGSSTASLTTTATIGSDLTFQAGAAYRGSGQGWLFDAALMPSAAGYSIAQLLDALPGEWGGLPSDVASVSFTQLTGWFDTASDESGFATTLQWSPATPFFGSYTVQGEAQFSLQHLKDPATGALAYSGFLAGQLQINALTVTVQYNFGIATQPQPGHAATQAQYQFSIAYGGATLTANVKKDADGNDVLTVNLGGVSLGEILGFLVNLADPGANYRLPSPWDLLYQVNFDALTLTINMTTKAVSVSDAIDLELGFAHVDTISLTYADKAGVSGVTFAMTGRFGDEPYTNDSPLAWDVINDPPPTPPGKGEAALDLRFVGLGQNVGFAAPAAFDNVAAVITAMTAGFPPAGASGPSPLGATKSALAFTGDGRWLIGADFTVAEAISLQVVFNDPALYGLHISLSGAKVKKLAGLDFDILYKKVTDTIGVYHIDLTLPTAMRSIDFGAVTVTLPPVSIDIYTNGNFYIDCGFPVDMDFSKSASVQAATFTGRGGFYFGILDGATSTKVPQISNGTFSPVIEVGLALSIEYGRTFNEGVIEAGLTLAVEGSLEGVFAWFEPTDRSQPSGMFYRVVGTAELRGHLYGEINFVIIQARLDVLAYAKLTLIVESHAPIEVELELGVEVSASVKIVFFTIHFHFSTSLDLSFKIGSSSATPWAIASTAAPAAQLAQQRRGQWRRPASAAALHRRLLSGLGGQGSFDWTPPTFYPVPETLPLTLGISLTTAFPTGATAPAVQAVLSLYVESSVPVSASNAREARRIEMEAPATAPFNRLAADMLRWALGAYQRPDGAAGPAPSVYAMAADLEAIGDYLADSSNWRASFSYAQVTRFIANNYRFEIASPQSPGASGPTGPASVAVFPMIPELGLLGPTAADAPPLAIGADIETTMAMLEPEIRWFRDQAKVGGHYEAALNAYYAQLRGPMPGASGASGASDLASTESRQGPESLSSFVFRDYFAMVAKGAASSARAMLKAYPFQPTGASGVSGPSGPPAETLASIAAQFPGPTLAYDTGGWESLASISGLLGVPLDELRRANPGLGRHGDRERLPAGYAAVVPAGASPASIVNANGGYPLQTGASGPASLPLDGVLHQVMAGTGPGAPSESLHAIGATYGFEPADLFGGGPAGLANGRNRQLLQPGATLTVPPLAWTAASGLDVADPAAVAGFFVARAVDPPSPADGKYYELVNWYAQYIQTNNSGLSGPTWAVPLMGWTGASGPGGASGQTPVLIGATQYAVQGLAATGATAPLAGPLRDTVELAAAGLVLQQLGPQPHGDFYRDFLNDIIPAGNSLQTPPLPRTVQPGDSFAGLGALLGVGATLLAENNGDATGLLQPLAVVALPTIQYGPQPGDTLGSIAAAFDLTLDQLAACVADTPGLLQPWSPGGQTLTIPNLPGRDTESLIADLVGFGRFNDVSGMVSRFLMHGMRAPEPRTGPVGTFPPSEPLYSLYGLIGQEFPVPGASGPTGFSLGLVSATGWAGFTAPAPTGPSGATTGPAPTDSIQLEVPSEFVADHSPAPTLAIDFAAGPSALPLYADRPRHYPFEQAVHWQTPGPVGLTGLAPAGEGQPSLWPLPKTLQSLADAGAAGARGPAWGLYAAAATDPTGASAAPIVRAGWGCAVDLSLRRVRDSAGRPVANVYLLMGADEAGKARLLQLWPALDSADDQLFLLHAPSVTSGNPQGLVSDSLDLEGTAILKAGLSTVTHGPAGLAASAADVPPFTAAASDPHDFVKLAWEASVTAQGGFYLIYRQVGGGDLPAALFGDGDDATIRLLAITASQGVDGQANLQPFNNVAIVGENVPAYANVFARLAQPGSDVYRTAAVSPGYAGFYLVRDNPTPPGFTGNLPPALQTQSLYQLVGCRIEGNDDFAMSNAATPASPLDGGTIAVPGPTGDGYWRYRTLLPVYRFGLANACPESAALPPASENPYRGIRGPSGASPLAQARMPLDFYDLFGNSTAFGATLPVVEATIGYTDEIVAPGSWPGAGAAYAFRPGATAGEISLEARLSLQPGRYMPDAAYTYARSSAAAAADAARYAQIFYQVQQPDYGFAIDTNLGTIAADPALLKPPLAAFVTRALLYANAAGALQQCQALTGADDNLASLASAWRTDVASLAIENQDVGLQTLFAGDLVIPDIRIAAPSKSLADLAQGATARTGNRRRRGAGLRLAETEDVARAASVPAPAAAAAITPLDIATLNQTVPLTPGLVLTIPAVEPIEPEPTFVVPNVPGTGFSLVSLLAKFPTATLAGVVAANREAKGFFAAGGQLLFGSASIALHDSDTFASLSAEYNVPVEALGLYNPGTLKPQVELAVPALVRLPAGATAYAGFAPTPADSLASVAEVFGLGPTGYQLIGSLSAELRGLFADGVSITGPSGSAQPGTGDSIASVAARLGMEQAALIQQIGGKTGLYGPGAALIAPLPRVPGPDFAPAVAALAGQLNIGTGATSSMALLEANRALDGFLKPGATVQGPAGLPPLTVQPHDTVDTLLTAIHAAATGPFGLAELAAANAGKTGLLGVGATFLVPPPPTMIGLTLQPQIPPPGASGEGAILFPVGVTIGASRDPAWVHPDFSGVTGTAAVQAVASALGPEGATSPGGAIDLKAFADEFEAAFAAQRLKCAVSENKSADPDAKIWAVNLGPQGASGIAVQSPNPAFYALAPLARSLTGGNVAIASYQSGAGLGPTAVRSFSSVDLDAWMLSFTTAVDMVLGPQYAAAAYLSGASGPSGPAGLAAAPGGGAFDSIVQAKQRIAAGLTGQVLPILAGVDTDGGVAQAKETLYQQMLERLSDAYSVAAIVQYPVDMESPCGPSGGGAYAPRLSGRIVPDLQVVAGPDAGTLDEAATRLGVSTAFLAQTVADVRGLVAAGVPLERNGASYTTTSSDSLTTIAANLKIPLATWVDWTAFGAWIGAEPVLAAFASIPAVRISRTVEAEEDANTLAAFFGTSIEALCNANQDVPGVPNPPWPQGTTLGYVTLLPDVDLSSAKVAMASGDPLLSFTVTLKRPELHRNLFLNLRFVVTEIEHGIADVADAPGYQSSSWLRLVRPLGLGDDSAEGVDLTIAQVQIPLPLRFYPTPGTLIAQTGLPTPLSGGSTSQLIAQGRDWDYSFDLRSDNESQDVTHLDVQFGTDGGTGDEALAADQGTLFAALAQFVDVWPTLSADLARLLAAPPGDTAATAAAEAFAAICAGVAAAFEGNLGDSDFATWADRYRYRMIPSGATASLTDLQLVNEDGPGSVWPDIWVQNPAAATGATPAPFVSMTGSPGFGATGHYQYPPDTPADAPLVHRFRFDGRDILANRDGWAGARLTRNEDLITSGPLGTTGPGWAPPPSISVSPQFVYSTPMVRFVEPLRPFVDRPDPIDVAGLTGTSAPLPIEQHLENMLTAVAGPTGMAGLWLSGLYSYGFPVAPGGPTATMPVLMMPAQPFAAAGISALAGELGQSLRAWQAGAAIAGSSGALVVDLTLSAPPPGASGLKPLLEYEALTIAMAAIDWNE